MSLTWIIFRLSAAHFWLHCIAWYRNLLRKSRKSPVDWVLRVRTDMLFSSLPAHARSTFLAFRGPFRGLQFLPPRTHSGICQDWLLASQLGMRHQSLHRRPTVSKQAPGKSRRTKASCRDWPEIATLLTGPIHYIIINIYIYQYIMLDYDIV